MTNRASLPRLIAFAAALIAGLALAFGAVPVQAHDQLIGSNPKQGAKLDKQPEWIELEYSGDIQNIGNEIRVERDGEDYSAGEITVEGRTVKAALPDDLKPGDYTISWRVVSQDGHPISGTVDFTILDSASSGGDVADDNADSAGDASDDNADQQTNASDQEKASEEGSGVSPVMLVLLGIAGVGIIAAVVMLLTRKKNAFDDK